MDFPVVNGVQAVVGKPGGGKGAYAVEVALGWLVNTPYKIVGNFALLHGKIADYLHKHYPDKDFDIFNRVIILNDQQAQQFFRYRNLDHLEKPLAYQHILTKDIIADKDFTLSSNKIGVDYSSVNEPVLYLLDEAQNLFNNRAFAETGFPVRFYLSQHRKLHDNVLLITQNMSLVDKSFRAWCQNFVYCRNLSKEMVNRFLRAPKKMRRLTYLQALESNPTQEPEGTVEVDFNIEILSCYDTNGGVGIKSQTKGAEKSTQRGISTRWLLYPAVAVVVALVVAFMFLPRFLAKFGQKATASIVSTAGAIAPSTPAATYVPTTTYTPPQLPPAPSTTPLPFPYGPSSTALANDNRVEKIFTPQRLDLDTYVARLQQLQDTLVIPLDDQRVYVKTAPANLKLVQELDAKVKDVNITLSIHSFQKNKDYSFSLDKLDLKADMLQQLSSGAGVVGLNLGKLVASFGLNNLNYINTDKYNFRLFRGQKVKIERGIEIPIISTTTQNNATVTTTSYKPVLNVISITPRFLQDDKILLSFSLQLQNLIDRDNNAISTTTMALDYVVSYDTSYVLLDLATILKAKSNGLLSFNKQDQQLTYVVTLDVAPVSSAATAGGAGVHPPAPAGA